MLKQAVLFALGVSSCAASHLFERQSNNYPDVGAVGPRPRQAWVDALARAKAAGKIPDDAPSTQPEGQNPYYASGVDTGPNGVCSWTLAECFGSGDLYDVVDAPASMWGVSFDDGPAAGSSTLYKFLTDNNQKATHFMIGGAIASNPDLFDEAVASGGHIASHTWSHQYMTALSDLEVLGELGWTSQIVYDRSGLIPAFFRPPYGDTDNRVRAIALEVFGMRTIIWNHDSADWCLADGGGSTCGGSGPQSDQELASSITTLQTGAKSPGIILLEHETRERTVKGFIDTYPGLRQNRWDARAIPDLWDAPWYLNAASNTAPRDSSITVGSGGGGVPAQNSSSTSTSGRTSSTSSSLSSTSSSTSASSQTNSSIAVSSESSSTTSSRRTVTLTTTANPSSTPDSAESAATSPSTSATTSPQPTGAAGVVSSNLGTALGAMGLAALAVLV